MTGESTSLHEVISPVPFVEVGLAEKVTTEADIRYDWNAEELSAIYHQSFPDLIFRAQLIHRTFFSPQEVQRSTLLSVKIGGCPDKCKYCPQSAHYDN